MTTVADTVMKQPIPEQIDTPEQALRAALLDPDTESRESSWPLGYIDGQLAGRQWSHLGVLSSEQAEQRHLAYAGTLAPLPFAQALDATNERGLPRYDAKQLRTIGWLTGWSDATEFADHALTCEGCGRRLFADLDDIHECRVLGIHGCATPVQDCYRAFCYGRAGGHATECYGDDS